MELVSTPSTLEAAIECFSLELGGNKTLTHLADKHLTALKEMTPNEYQKYVTKLGLVDLLHTSKCSQWADDLELWQEARQKLAEREASDASGMAQGVTAAGQV